MSDLGNDVLLAQSELSVDTATVTFSSIPSTYKDLVVFYSARGTAGALTTMKMRFNGLTTTTYNDYNYAATTTAWAVTGSQGTAASSFDLSTIPDSRWATGYFSSNFIQIFGYSKTNVYKNFQCKQGTVPNSGYTANCNIGFIFGQNSSFTGQITQLDFFPSTGSFAAGSSFYLFAYTR